MKKLIAFLIIVFAWSLAYSNEEINRIYIRFKSNEELDYQKTLLARQNLKVDYLLRPENSIHWKFRNFKIKDNYILSNLNKILEAEEPLLRTVIVEIPETENAEKFCKKLLAENPAIEIAEPILPDLPLGIPNDPYASQQAMLANIKAFETWDFFEGDSSVVIGIVDTGILQDHEDLINSIAPNWGEIPNNQIDDDGNGYLDDFFGVNLAYPTENSPDNTYHTNEHGTSVAGIAGATTNNGKGIAGVANKCRIFPIKASKLNNPDRLDYGYQGILYAAIRGFKVVNCSWGRRKAPSAIDQSIIDYAVARGVVVVAAGGNGNNTTEVWYPAGYRGVLAVGEVNQLDYFTNVSTINETIRILAPGEGNWITTNSTNGYVRSTYGGTSFASPVVAGVTAIVRAKYPELNPLETIEYVRQLGDDVSANNPSFEKMLPSRINMKKMLEILPSSIPGISPIRFITKRTNGTIETRFALGDTVVFFVETFNHLGDANNLNFILSVADIFDSSLEPIETEFTLNNYPSKSQKILGPFSFKIIEQRRSRTFLRIDIEGENGYHDFFLVPFVPTSLVTNFENDSIFFSISDKGTIGFYGQNDEKVGMGIGQKLFGNQLYKGCLLVCEDSTRVVSGLFSFTKDRSDFDVVKPFVEPQKEVGILNDNFADSQNKIGIEIKQVVYVPRGGENYFKISLYAKNTSQRTLKNLSFGYFFDWDIGMNSDSNRSYLVPEAVPKTIIPIAAAVQFSESNDSSIIVGVGVYSPNSKNKPQMAVLTSSILSNFSQDKQILALNSDLSLQYQKYDDIGNVCGMKFPTELNPDDEVGFEMMIAFGRSKNELTNLFLSNLLASDVEEQSPRLYHLILEPNPATDRIRINLPQENISECVCEIFDYFGNRRFTQKIHFYPSFFEIPISFLPQGMYFLKVYTSNEIYIGRFVKIEE